MQIEPALAKTGEQVYKVWTFKCIGALHHCLSAKSDGLAES